MKSRTTPRPERGRRLLDHTADLRIEFYGTDLRELFINAAVGLTSVLSSGTHVSPDTETDILLEADTVEELLVDWLREILFLNQAQGFTVARVEIVRLSETGIAARLYGRVRPEGVQPEAEIKAATYHGLSVDKTPTGYSAKVVFDI